MHAESLAPRLKAQDRVQLFELLWGGIDFLSALFVELKGALDSLENAESVFVSLDAIQDRLPGKTVLHVLTMKHGLADDLSKSEQGTVALADGRTVTIRKPVITALACELVAKLEATAWPFLEHTDLLDFPGARERLGLNGSRAAFFDKEKEYPIGEAFLRGKVAVLFENYSTDLDLNTLVACHKAEQIREPSYPPMVEEWVRRTHGVDAESRQNIPCNLFFCLLYTSPSPRDRQKSRMPSSA